MTMGVKERSEREAEWRGTAVLGSEEGPSTRTYFIHCQPGALADCLFVLCAGCDVWVFAKKKFGGVFCANVDISMSVDLSGSRQEDFTYALVVDDLDNSGELLSVGTGAEEDDTADLDESPLAGLDVCVTHFDCLFWRVGSDELFQKLMMRQRLQCSSTRTYSKRRDGSVVMSDARESSKRAEFESVCVGLGGSASQR